MLNKNFKRRKQGGNNNNSVVKTEVPVGWYVYEAGQKPLHMLWYILLVNFNDVCNKVENPSRVFVQDCDSFDQALKLATEKINNIS
ncbi:hypothetical protein [Nonlabens sp.]|uniref:hypothetical protein n=1 Tax=Nonlabens sp. TaxID=1888209 RepID=UPI0025ECE274|nr:hypothetical protein [Nonlabens sp.]